MKTEDAFHWYIYICSRLYKRHYDSFIDQGRFENIVFVMSTQINEQYYSYIFFLALPGSWKTHFFYFLPCLARWKHISLWCLSPTRLKNHLSFAGLGPARSKNRLSFAAPGRPIGKITSHLLG